VQDLYGAWLLRDEDVGELNLYLLWDSRSARSIPGTYQYQYVDMFAACVTTVLLLVCAFKVGHRKGRAFKTVCGNCICIIPTL
jgi:hypothetical protein